MRLTHLVLGGRGAARPGVISELGRAGAGANYHRGMMAGRTPNIDKMAAEGMLFTEEPSHSEEVWYLGESELGEVRIDDYKFRFVDQPAGWLGDKTKPDVPYITNRRLDPFERTDWPDRGTKIGSQSYFEWFKYESWRFVFVQQQVLKLAETAIEFPPMQKGASFNLDAVKAKIEAAGAAIAK